MKKITYGCRVNYIGDGEAYLPRKGFLQPKDIEIVSEVYKLGTHIRLRNKGAYSAWWYPISFFKFAMPKLSRRIKIL